MKIRVSREKVHYSKDYRYGLLIILLTLPHLKPAYFDEIPFGDALFNGARVLSFAIVLVWYVFIRKKVSKIITMMIIMEVFLLINTYSQGGDVYGYLVIFFSTISIAILYDMVEDKKETFVSAQLFCYEILIYINFITEILFPGGMYQAFYNHDNFFLGYYNGHDKYFLPALMFAFLYKYMTGRKMRAYTLTVVIYVSALLVWSGGILVELFGMAIVYIFFKNKTRMFNFLNYWLINVLFFIFIIVLKFQNLFRWLIEDILHKWRALEGRMRVWQVEIESIKRVPIWGYGLEFSTQRVLRYGWAVHAHNLLLEILHQGGIIYLTLFFLIIIIAGKDIMENKNREPSKIISIAVLGWCIHGLVEPPTGALYIGILVIAYHCKVFWRDGDIKQISLGKKWSMPYENISG